MPPVAPLAPLVGTLFAGRFRIKALLGRGGMGSVYLAQHTVLERPVAVKVIRKDLIHDDDVAARFRREARAASRIANPHVTAVFDFGHTEDGQPYLVMEHVPGETVGALLDRGERFTVERSVRILIQVADALAAAHASQVVHRDLQARNIVLSPRRGREDFVKILDFGLAKLLDQARSTTRPLTADGTLVGTPEYMAPEQCLGEAVGPATDIYAMGILAFELLTGGTPFRGGLVDVVTGHVYSNPPPPSARAQTPLPSGLDELVLACLAKKPDARPTATVCLDELTRIYRAITSDESVDKLKSKFLVTRNTAFAGANSHGEDTLPVRRDGDGEARQATIHDAVGRGGGAGPSMALCDLAFAVRDRGLGPVALSELAATLVSAGDRLLEDEVQLNELERERMEVEVRAGRREARLSQALAQLEHERQTMRAVRLRRDQTRPGLGGIPADDEGMPARLDRNALELSKKILAIAAEAEKQITAVDRRMDKLRGSIEKSRSELVNKEQLLLAMLVQTVAAEGGSFDEALRELFVECGLGRLLGESAAP